LESDVNKKIFDMSVFFALLIYIAAGCFMIIENMFPENLIVPYKFHVALYFTTVTLTTVGYGDYFPQTAEGRMFILCMILYAIVIKIPS
jgi:voltage-gated potassium channel